MACTCAAAVAQLPESSACLRRSAPHIIRSHSCIMIFTAQPGRGSWPAQNVSEGGRKCVTDARPSNRRTAANKNRVRVSLVEDSTARNVPIAPRSLVKASAVLPCLRASFDACASWNACSIRLDICLVRQCSCTLAGSLWLLPRTNNQTTVHTAHGDLSTKRGGGGGDLEEA